MYPRLLQPSPKQSFFLFGPRGVGKTAWAHEQFPDALFFDRGVEVLPFLDCVTQLDQWV